MYDGCLLIVCVHGQQLETVGFPARLLGPLASITRYTAPTGKSIHGKAAVLIVVDARACAMAHQIWISTSPELQGSLGTYRPLSIAYKEPYADVFSPAGDIPWRSKQSLASPYEQPRFERRCASSISGTGESLTGYLFSP